MSQNPVVHIERVSGGFDEVRGLVRVPRQHSHRLHDDPTHERSRIVSTSRTARVHLRQVRRAADTNGITVGELRAALSDVPDDIVVVLSADGEGNHHSPLAEASVGLYEAETTWRGDVRVSDEQIGHDGFTEEDRAGGDALPVVVLWPTN